MYCSKCGALNPEETSVCSACGASLKTVQNEVPVAPIYQGNQVYNNQNSRPRPTVPNNLVLSIVVLVISVLGCCFYGITIVSVVLSIIAVVLASQVNTKEFSGDIIGAEKSAKTAKILSFVSIGVIVLAIIIVIIIVVVLLVSYGSYNFNY